MKLNHKMFLIIFFLFVLSCSDNIDTYYNDFHDTKLIEAINKGWIPNIIPSSATEIYERHNLDSNRLWLTFRFNSSDIKSMTDQLKLANDEIDQIEFSNPGVSWWPEYIDKKSLASHSSHELSLYKYDRFIIYPNNKKATIMGYFLIDWKSNRTYYWQFVK